MTLATPWLITTALEARLHQIHPDNGFATDAGDAVILGQSDIERGVITLLLIEQEEQVLGRCREDGTLSVRLPLLVEGHTPCNYAAPNQAAHVLRHDIERALYGPGLLLVDPTAEIEPAGYVILPREPGSTTIAVQVKLQVTYLRNVRA